MLIAEVYINIPVKRIASAFSYLVPPELAFLGAGWRVVVPFSGRKVEGFIVSVSNREFDGDFKLKSVESTVDDEPWFSPKMFEQAMWLADHYLCSPAEAMRLFMPGKSGVKIKKTGQDYLIKEREAKQFKNIITLTAKFTVDVLPEFKSKKAQLRLLKYLRDNGPTEQSVLRQAGFSLPVIKALTESGLAEIQTERVFRDSYTNLTSTAKDEPLTDEQQQVWQHLSAAIDKRENEKFLLYGVTGSGKTRVYIETVKKVREQGRQAIVLVPEIALTGQAVSVFKNYFADDIVVLHSHLSVAERNDAIGRIRRGDVGIAIGARSALFVPFADIGAIILDEEQDSSYKQEENPAYSARAVAEAFAEIHHSLLLLGSATPSLETYYRAKQGELTLLELPHRIDNKVLPSVELVDMRQELKHGNRHIISRSLERLITETINRREQLIIMLNRRGYSTFVMCRSCGQVISCQYCGMPLVYHVNGELTCHHCDIRADVPDVCPKCGSTYIKYFGSGTEKLEQELRTLVPTARIVRMDRDTTVRKEAHNEILGAFRRHEFDILLGTQMVAKGHDIPNVTGVGIISADSCLNLPDFRAAERCFMLITQTTGRAGRGEVPGRVVVQTYNPEHYAVQLAQKQDYAAFFNQEMEFRRALNYPPYCRLIKLTIRHPEEQIARDLGNTIKQQFTNEFAGNEKQQIIGPFPALVAKWREFYRFCILIKTNDLSAVQNFLRSADLNRRPELMIDIDPISTN